MSYLSLLILIISSMFIANCKELLSVIVLFRHGDRTPLQPYPNDPYKDRSLWPVGFGQLINKGKQRHYELGEWFRNRYDGFLPKKYSENDIYIRSTDYDRTLMSAAANLAALYPPIDDQLWNPDLAWQPIPIHTEDLNNDKLIGTNPNCPTHTKILNLLQKNGLVPLLDAQNKDLYEYVSLHSGSNITNVMQLAAIFDTLQVEEQFNLTLPEWTQKVYPEPMQSLYKFAMTQNTATGLLARLKVGVLIHTIVEHFSDVAAGKQYKKMLMFSAHDITIVNILNALRIFLIDPELPPYASTLMFELYKEETGYYVNVLYKKLDVVREISLLGCDFNCNFYTFVQLLSLLNVSEDELDRECFINF